MYFKNFSKIKNNLTNGFEFFKFALLLPRFHFLIFMGPVLVLYIAFASISFFVSFLQLFISLRKSGDLLFLVCAVLSLFVFTSFSLLALCSSSFGISFPPLTLLRYVLLLYQVAAICFLGAIYYLLKVQNRLHILVNISFLGLLLLICYILPDNVLFGENATTRILVLPQGDHLLMIATGFTWWRAIIDLTVFVFSLSAFLLLVKRWDFISFRTIIILFSGLGVILLAALYDQLVDLGLIHTTYMLPFALFILYIIIIFIPFVFFIKEIIDQQILIQQEKKWRNLIEEADIIVVELNRMGHVEYINPYFFKLTGYEEDEVLGKDWFEFFIPSKDYNDLQGTFIEILESKFYLNYINPIITKNKEEKLIRWFNVRTMNHYGKISGSLSIGIDVTNDRQEKEVLIKKLQDATKLSSHPDCG